MDKWHFQDDFQQARFKDFKTTQNHTSVHTCFQVWNYWNKWLTYHLDISIYHRTRPESPANISSKINDQWCWCESKRELLFVWSFKWCPRDTWWRNAVLKSKDKKYHPPKFLQTSAPGTAWTSRQCNEILGDIVRQGSPVHGYINDAMHR